MNFFKKFLLFFLFVTVSLQIYSDTILISPDCQKFYRIVNNEDQNTAEIKVFNLNTLQHTTSIPENEGIITTMAINSGGQYFAYATYNSATRKCILKLFYTFAPIGTIRRLEFNEPILKIALSPDGRQLTVIEAQVIRIISLVTTELIYESRHNSELKTCLFSPDGLYFVASSNDASQIFDLSAQPISPIQVPGSVVALYDQCLEVVRQNKDLHVINLKTKQTSDARPQKDKIIQIAYSPNSKYAAFVYEQPNNKAGVTLIDLETEKSCLWIPHIESFAFSPDKQYFICISQAPNDTLRVIKRELALRD